MSAPTITRDISSTREADRQKAKAVPPPPPGPLMKFRLRQGSHIVRSGFDQNGDPILRTVHARDNEIIETDLDLDMLFNFRDNAGNVVGDCIKFERLYPGDGTAATLSLPEGAEVWMPDKETIEEFGARMRLKVAAVTPIQAPADLAVKKQTLIADAMRTFDAMTLVELQKHAKEELVVLGNAKSRDEVLRVVKAAALTQFNAAVQK